MLKQKLSKEHLKANHNLTYTSYTNSLAETKIVKGTFESKSQLVCLESLLDCAETKIVKGTFESKSQPCSAWTNP